MKLKIPWKRLLRFGVFLFLVLVSVIAVLLAWSSHQGRKEWVKTRDELLARGEKLLPTELAPPPVPREENFFGDPIWEELAVPLPAVNIANLGMQADLPAGQRQLEQLKTPLSEAELIELKEKYPEFPFLRRGVPLPDIMSEFSKIKGEPQFSPREAELVLALVRTKDPVLGRIKDLAMRPSARFPFRYEDGLQASFSHVSRVSDIARIWKYEAIAHLVLKQNAAALEDILLMLRLANAIKDEPFLISVLVRSSVVAQAIGAAKKGMPDWSAAELSLLQEALSEVDLSSHFALALRGERASFNTLEDALKQRPAATLALLESEPAGDTFAKGALSVPARIYIYAFGDSERAFANQYMQAHIDGIESHLPLVKPSALEKLEEPLQRILGGWNRYRHILVSIWMPAITGSIERLAKMQSEITQARTAFAVQRYWLASKALPENLAALVPAYLEKVPVDIIDGSPLRYRKTGESTFLLWSIGSNDTDENGVSGEKRGQNDWVWEGRTTN